MFNLRSHYIILNPQADTKDKSLINSFYNTIYLIKEFSFFVYTGMLYSLCILQGYKTSLILNNTPKVISEKDFVKLNLTLKNHMDKQFSNKTGLIRFAYLTI